MAVDVSRIPNNNKFDPVREAILQLQTDIEDTGNTIGNGTLTISTSSPLTGSGTFTANQTGPTSISIGIDGAEYLTNITHDTVNQKLVVTYGDGTTADLSLAQYIDDTNLARLVSGTLDNQTGIATFTRDDATTFTVDLSALFDDTDTNDFLTSASFSTANGIITFGVTNQASVTVDIDGRYPLISELTAVSNDIITSADFSATDNRFKLTLTQADAGTIEASFDDVVLSESMAADYIPYVKVGGGDGDTTNAILNDSFLKINGSTLELDWDTGNPLTVAEHDLKMRKDGGGSGTYYQATYAADSVSFLHYASSLDIDTAKIGATTTGRIRINDTYSLPVGDGTSGQVLSTNGSGDLSWVAAGGPTTSDLDDVTTNGNTTTNSITVNNLTTIGNINVGAALGLSDDNALHLRGITDPTHKIYYRSGANVWDYNVPIKFEYYNSGTPVERFSLNESGNLSITGSLTALGNVNALGGSFTDPVTIYDSSAVENPRLSVGRDANQNIRFYLDDRIARITHLNDETTGDHTFEFTIDSPSGADKRFFWYERLADGTSAFELMHLDSEGLNISGEARIVGDDKGVVVSSADYIVGTIGAKSGAEPDYGQLTLRQNGSNNVVINANGSSYFLGGDIGIGNTATSGEKLQVSGSVYINQENAGFIVDAGGDKRVGLMKYSGHEGVISRVSGQDFGIVRVGGSNIKDVTGLVYDIYVGGTGDTSINNNLFVGQSLDGTNYLQLSENQIYRTGGDLYLQWSGGSNIIMANSGKNVGIGISSPSGKLHVDSGIAHNNIYFTTGSSGGTGYDVRLYLNGGANNSEMSINMGIVGNEDRDRIRTYQGNMYFRTNDSENMIINSAGNVLINQTSNLTGQALQVNGFIDQTATTAAFRLYNGSTFVGGIGNGNWAYGATWNGYYSIYANSSLLLFNAGGGSSPTMALDNNGRLGINTTSPAAQLSVYDEDGGNSMLQVRNYATSATGSFTGNYMVELRSAYATGSTGGALLVHTQESSDSRPTMQVSSTAGVFATFVNGKVGIGTDTPSAKLDVIGIVRSYAASNNYAQLNNGSFQAVGDHGGTFMIDVDNNGTADLVNVKKSGSSRFYIQNGGNVGINDTSPNAKTSIVSSDSSVPTLRISNEAAGGSGFVFQRWAYIRTSDAYKLDLVQEVSSGLVQYRFDLTNNSTTYTSNLVLDRGNVGIGTSSPDHKLQVNGGTSNVVAHFQSTDSIGGIKLSDSTGNVELTTSGTDGFDVRPAGGNALFRINGNGSGYLSSGFFGIGNTSASMRLHISESGANISSNTAVFGSSMKGIMIQNTNNDNSSNGIWFATNGVHWAGITGQRDNYLSTWGTDLRFYTHDASTTNLTSSYEVARMTSGGALHVKNDIVAFSTTTSDARLKDDVKTIDNALEKIMNLRGVEYVWNNGGRKGQKDLGLIAQEVEQVIPEIVREHRLPLVDDSDIKYKTVDYEKMVGVLIEAIKEQQKQIDELKARLNA